MAIKILVTIPFCGFLIIFAGFLGNIFNFIAGETSTKIVAIGVLVVALFLISMELMKVWCDDN